MLVQVIEIDLFIILKLNLVFDHLQLLDVRNSDDIGEWLMEK